LSSSDHLGPSISPPLTLGFPAGLFLVHQSDDFFWMLAQRANDSVHRRPRHDGTRGRPVQREVRRLLEKAEPVEVITPTPPGPWDKDVAAWLATTKRVNASQPYGHRFRKSTLSPKLL